MTERHLDRSARVIAVLQKLQTRYAEVNSVLQEAIQCMEDLLIHNKKMMRLLRSNGVEIPEFVSAGPPTEDILPKDEVVEEGGDSG